MTALGFVAACNAVIWIGLWIYLLRLDSRLKAAERRSGPPE
ncbi:MAG TPA: CcmD family protein [Thermoanaerobaculia bacterium]|jgi:CcmD family protein|nr:CcmD family protein [Thermoanaerobaculia bacterium]